VRRLVTPLQCQSGSGGARGRAARWLLGRFQHRCTPAATRWLAACTRAERVAAPEVRDAMPQAGWTRWRGRAGSPCWKPVLEACAGSLCWKPVLEACAGSLCWKPVLEAQALAWQSGASKGAARRGAHAPAPAQHQPPQPTWKWPILSSSSCLLGLPLEQVFCR
jgi:hypothetical protein